MFNSRKLTIKMTDFWSTILAIIVTHTHTTHTDIHCVKLFLAWRQAPCFAPDWSEMQLKCLKFFSWDSRPHRATEVLEIFTWHQHRYSTPRTSSCYSLLTTVTLGWRSRGFVLNDDSRWDDEGGRCTFNEAVVVAGAWLGEGGGTWLREQVLGRGLIGLSCRGPGRLCLSPIVGALGMEALWRTSNVLSTNKLIHE